MRSLLRQKQGLVMKADGFLPISSDEKVAFFKSTLSSLLPAAELRVGPGTV